MGDLIDRQAAIKALSIMQGIVAEIGVRKGISFAWQQIKDLPSAQPEIIRCKDCKRYGKDNCFVKIQMLWELRPDDYCSYGERKEGKQDE